MKTLIIAEKPSLAKNICAAITPTPKWVAGTAKNSGCWENDDYIVSYAFGHLLGLYDAEDYDDSYKAWSVDVLPILPREFKYKQRGDAGAKAQLKLARAKSLSETSWILPGAKSLFTDCGCLTRRRRPSRQNLLR